MAPDSSPSENPSYIVHLEPIRTNATHSDSEVGREGSSLANQYVPETRSSGRVGKRNCWKTSVRRVGLCDVEVTGASNGWGLTRVGRFHRRDLELYMREAEMSGRFSRRHLCSSCVVGEPPMNILYCGRLICGRFNVEFRVCLE